MKLKQKGSILGLEPIMRVRDSSNQTVVRGSIVTVEEIRHILWPNYGALSDADVQWIITLFSSFAKLAIAEHLAEKREQMKKSIQSRNW